MLEVNLSIWNYLFWFPVCDHEIMKIAKIFHNTYVHEYMTCDFLVFIFYECYFFLWYICTWIHLLKKKFQDFKIDMWQADEGDRPRQVCQVPCRGVRALLCCQLPNMLHRCQEAHWPEHRHPRCARSGKYNNHLFQIMVQSLGYILLRSGF
jgi:hypothetical protein